MKFIAWSMTILATILFGMCINEGLKLLKEERDYDANPHTMKLYKVLLISLIITATLTIGVTIYMIVA